MNKWKIGSFYTVPSPYEELFKIHLESSCKKLNLQDRLITRTNKCCGDWLKNVAQKPKVILDILNNYLEPDESLVFLDADCEIVKYPSLFDEIPEEYDIALHNLDWGLWYGYKSNPSVREILSGTLFLRNNEKVKTLCQYWFEEASHSNTWEQKSLQSLLNAKIADINVYWLPLEYIYMNTRPNGQEPLVKLDPVIVHYQASRMYKRNLKRI